MKINKQEEKKPISNAQLTKEISRNNNMPVNLLLSFALATACSAIAVKSLKKTELILLTGLMITPLMLLCVKNRHKHFPCCPQY